MEAPTPRVVLGQALRGIATAAIDISDGLLGDLGHILKSSQVGAEIDTEIASTLIAKNAAFGTGNGFLTPKNRLSCVLAGGDDYELAFTAPAAQHAAVLAAGVRTGTPVTCIGHIQAQAGVRLVDALGQPLANNYQGFDHFS
jgi:thiamine-monophosphate kinase